MFATTNHDLFLDNAIAKTSEPLAPNYRSAGYSPVDGTQTKTGPVLLKLHGSLGWRYCHSCLSMEVVSDTGHPSYQCPTCGDFPVPLIVPPTFFKKMDNAAITATWQAFRRCLQDTEHIIFCGYSFPDADMHVKYALKHREVVKWDSPLRVTVVNEHWGKASSARGRGKDALPEVLLP